MTQINPTAWQPSLDLNTHSGNLPSADAVFFMPPPPTIGALISIGTTFKTSTPKPLPVIVSSLLAIVVGGFIFTLLLLINRPILAIIVASILSVFVWSATQQFEHTCSYVGTDGIVSYIMTESRSVLPKESFMLFADADSLHTKTTRNYINGIYSGTSYTYTWKKYSGSTHAISGTYRSENNPPQENDPWYFANVSELVWSSYVLSTLDGELERQGYIEFLVATSSLQAVRVGRGFLEFVTKKEGNRRVLVSDMRDILLGSGTFQFKHQDAKWWSGKGKYSFEYANIPNARVFLICLKDLAEIYWD